MRNKKSLMSLGLLVLVLILGVGYAVISEVGLTIGGTASVGTTDLKVSFEGTVTPSSSKISGTATKGAKSATIKAENLVLNEEVSITYTIQNLETDVNALVTLGTLTEGGEAIVNDKNNYFEVTTNVGNGIPVGTGENNTATVTVTVKLIKTPIDSDDSTADITVNLKASPAQ